MSLSTYSDLQTSINNWLHRSDLTSVIPDFIALAEADIYRRLRVTNMENTGTTTLSAETLALPTGFRELRNIQLNTDPVTFLKYMAPADMDMRYGGTSGKPLFYAIIGNQFQFAPVPDGSYAVQYTYWAAFDPLATTSTNWLLTNHPDVFLYGALRHSAPYIQNDPRIAVWEMAYEKAMARVELEDEKKKYGGHLEMRPAVAGVDRR
jgi:hypothetical protein